MSEEAGQHGTEPYPKWHYLSTAGLWVFISGIALVIFAWFIFPDPPSGNDALPSFQELERYKSALTMHGLSNWIGNHMVGGGFFLWLAGRVIDAFRHPKHY